MHHSSCFPINLEGLNFSAKVLLVVRARLASGLMVLKLAVDVLQAVKVGVQGADAPEAVEVYLQAGVVINNCLLRKKNSHICYIGRGFNLAGFVLYGLRYIGPSRYISQ